MSSVLVLVFVIVLARLQHSRWMKVCAGRGLVVVVRSCPQQRLVLNRQTLVDQLVWAVESPDDRTRLVEDEARLRGSPGHTEPQTGAGFVQM